MQRNTVVAFPRRIEAIQRRAARAFEDAKAKAQWVAATPEAETVRQSEYPLWLVMALLGLAFILIGLMALLALVPVAAWSCWRGLVGKP